jgi:hypothetical protein
MLGTEKILMKVAEFFGSLVYVQEEKFVELSSHLQNSRYFHSIPPGTAVNLKGNTLLLIRPEHDFMPFREPEGRLYKKKRIQMKKNRSVSLSK